MLKGRNSKSAIHYFNKVSFLPQDESLSLRRGEILARFGICPQAGLVSLVSSQTVECDQSPSHIVSAFIGKKIARKVSAQAWNNAAPGFGVFLKSISLKWIDLIADDARYLHKYPPGIR